MSSELQEQLWKAGKKGITTIVVLTLLPVFLPLVFILSVFFFTSVLPLLCGIAVLFYLQKLAMILMPCHVTADSIETKFESGMKKNTVDLERQRSYLKVPCKESTVMEVRVGGERDENGRKNGMESVTPKNFTTERGGSYLNPLTSSGTSGPESMILDYSSLEMFQSDNDSSASEEESFDSTSHVNFTRASTSEGTTGMQSFPFEGFAGLRPSGSLPSSKGRSEMMKSDQAPAYSTDMYESEEQLHLQQFSWLLQYWRRKEFQAGPHALGQAKLRNELRLLRKVHDEEEQLKQELKAVKSVVGNRKA